MTSGYRSRETPALCWRYSLNERLDRLSQHSLDRRVIARRQRFRLVLRVDVGRAQPLDLLLAADAVLG